MRIATWNCRVGGFRKKAARIAPFRPDVLAVQEVEKIDAATKFAGEIEPTYRDRATLEKYPRRSIGMFSYTGLNLKAVDYPDPTFAFRRYSAWRKGISFQVVAVWTYALRGEREKSYRQAHEGLIDHSDWILKRPTVILGDFNQSAAYKSSGWRTLIALMDSLGLVSAYHNHFKETFGAESRPTHFHHGRESNPFHLDYCFLPREWAQRITSVEVGAHGDWSDVSDHRPLIVDVDL